MEEVSTTTRPKGEAKKETLKPIKETDSIEMIVKDGILKVADLPKVYKQFRKPISEEGLQESSGSETKKGYDTLGYGYAWITERLNDVVPFCWRVLFTMDGEPREISVGTQGKKMIEVSYEVVLQLGNWGGREIAEIKQVMNNNVESPKMINKQVGYSFARDFQVLAETPPMDGGHKAFAMMDAKKGAKTNGLKKAAGFFGIGNEAYKKNIDEDNMAVKASLTKKRAKKKAAPKTAGPAMAANVQMVHKKLEALGAKTVAEKLALLKDKYKFTAFSIDKLSDKQVKMVLALLLK